MKERGRGRALSCSSDEGGKRRGKKLNMFMRNKKGGRATRSGSERKGKGIALFLRAGGGEKKKGK